jgi:ThiF family
MSSDSEMLDRTARLVQVDFYPQLAIEEIVVGLTAPHVAITADAASCACRSGQVAVLSCAIQIAQLGASLEFSLPKLESRLSHLPMQAQENSLFGVVAGAVAGIRPGALAPGRKPPDFEIVIGTDQCHVGAPTMYFGGDGFSCNMSRRLSSAPWKGSWPFGGVAAGAIAAAEVFRAAVSGLGDEAMPPKSGGDLLERQFASFALPPLPAGAAAIGRVDFGSAGAITNGALFALLEVPGFNAGIRLFDDDDVALSNLNRCGLFDRDSIGSAKVEALARFSTSAIQIEGVVARLDESTLADQQPLADAVCIGTDSVAARWQIQRHAPGWVCVGATSHLMALVSRHRAGDPCAGCLHPRDEDDGAPIPTVSFVSAMAGMLQAYFLLGRHRLLSRAHLAYPHALGSHDAFLELPLAANPACPVACKASQANLRGG